MSSFWKFQLNGNLVKKNVEHWGSLHQSAPASALEWIIQNYVVTYNFVLVGQSCSHLIFNEWMYF